MKMAHRRQNGEGEDEGLEKVPRVSMDYWFMGEDDREAGENPLIVVVNERTGEKYARAVGRKGVGTEGEMDWLIKDISEELKAWGHAGGENGKIILKSDGERSIVALREAVAKFHGGEVIPEQPPKGESQSNGIVEEAVRAVREFTRVFKEVIEDKANIQLEVDSVITLWLVRWAAMVVSRYLVGPDGRTGYESRTMKDGLTH